MKTIDVEDPEDLQEAWSRVMALWTEQNNLLSNSAGVGEIERQKIVRKWWELTSRVLWILVRSLAKDEETPLEPDFSDDHKLHEVLREMVQEWSAKGIAFQPLVLLAMLAEMSNELGKGNVHALLPGVVRTGRGQTTIRERKEIAIAIAYKLAVKEGRINDKSSTKTVCAAFGVTAQTVQNWVKRRGYICKDLPQISLDPEVLKERLWQAGSWYQSISNKIAK